MSIDLSAHFNVSRGDLDRQRLTDALNSDCPNVTRLISDWIRPHFLRMAGTPEPVRWEEWNAEGLPGDLFHLCVPKGNCVLTVRPTRAEFWVGVKWHMIWYSPEFQHFLRRACLDLARLFGSDAAVYMPEVVSAEGDTLEDVVRNLRRDRGAPAPTLAALAEVDEWDGAGCYYIDTFDDGVAHLI